LFFISFSNITAPTQMRVLRGYAQILLDLLVMSIYGIQCSSRTFLSFLTLWM